MVGAILTLTLMMGLLSAIEPLVLKSIFDALGGNASLVVTSVILLLVLGVGRELLSAVSNWLTWKTRLRVHYSLLDATVSRLHLLPVSFHRTEGVGAVMTRLDRGIQGFVGAVTEITFQVLPALVYLVISVVVMVRLEWRLALLVLLFAPLPAVLTALAAPTQTRRERRLLDAWARIYSRFNEVLSGIVTVKSFAMEDAERHRFLVGVAAANSEVVRGVGFDARVGAGQNLVVMLARVSALALGAWLVLHGRITAGTLVAFLGYVSGLFGPVQGLSGVYRTLQTASVAVNSIFSILDAHDQVADAPGAEEVPVLHGRVAFEGVRFHYDRLGGPILDGIDLEVEPGEMVAIVGPSGSGKSTLLALLQRFYDPCEGAVKLDGKDLRALKQRAVRRHVGVVLQDALLFNETVRDNIAYGRPSASPAEIEAAARAAHAHDFILKLPSGYDTIVGERGNRLSGGERQRLAIARALLKNPALLILDEATSALDAESEALVQAALERLVSGRTTFVVAHRLSTVVKADRIVVLRDGRIADIGSHKELVGRNGYYAHLVRSQLAGLIDLEPPVAA
ncbi:MAG: msbA9 [Myxococcales bacterium]|nr:msbA9 [Myxococcales bacterium]